MEFDRTRLRKTAFGNYLAADVDILLDTAEKLLLQKETERLQAIEDGRVGVEAAEKLTAQVKKQKEAGERLLEESRRLAERNQKLNAECRAHREAEEHLREELDNVRRQIEDIRTQLDLANSQTAILGDRVARQRRELDKKDQLLLSDPVGEATKQAEHIIRHATDMSRQMMDDAEGMRSRALAAVRAAYFNTMGFRRELDDRFASLQNDLNQSIRTLRAVEAEEVYDDKKLVQEKW